MTKPLKVPELALVVLVGASGSGKSTFARKHFKPTEILSSDACRGLVSDDENNQAATGDAFDLLHFIARKRLARGLLTVVDATNVQREVAQAARCARAGVPRAARGHRARCPGEGVSRAEQGPTRSHLRAARRAPADAAAPCFAAQARA